MYLKYYNFLTKNSIKEYNKIFKFIKKNNDKNILLVGQIQSGKTSLIMYLILYLTNIKNTEIIFLVGRTNDLLIQNQKIINKLFSFNNNIKSLIKNCVQLEKLKNDLIINPNITTYIIDDEADDYTTGENNSSLLLNQIKQLTKAKYIMITATPFYHFNIHDKNNYQYPTPYIIKQNNEYCSLSNFINNNKINKISNWEYNEFLCDQLLGNNKNNIMIKIIGLFLFNSFLFCSGRKKDTKMILNISVNTNDHHNLYQYIIDNINNVVNEYILKYIYEKYNSKYSINYIKQCLEVVVSKKYYGVIIFNKNYETNISNEENEYKIYIGQNRLNRGVVFNNLLSFCYFNNSKIQKADTLLQTCRFLGYRKKYFDFMEVYVSCITYDNLIILNNVISNFNSIKTKDDLIECLTTTNLSPT